MIVIVIIKLITKAHVNILTHLLGIIFVQSSVSQSSGSKVGVTSGTGIVDKAHSTILSNGTSISDPTRSFTHSRSLFSIGTGNQLFADVAIYRSSVVALKHIHKEHLQITRNILIEFNQVYCSLHKFRRFGAFIYPSELLSPLSSQYPSELLSSLIQHLPK